VDRHCRHRLRIDPPVSTLGDGSERNTDGDHVFFPLFILPDQPHCRPEVECSTTLHLPILLIELALWGVVMAAWRVLSGKGISR